MPHVVIRAAVESDASAILTLADRLPAFGPTTYDAADIAQRERRALADALSHPSDSSSLLVAEQSRLGLIGVIHLDTRRDYFTDQAHGYVAILAVAREAEGQGVGRSARSGRSLGPSEGLHEIDFGCLHRKSARKGRLSATRVAPGA